jgi:hypothetical protein
VISGYESDATPLPLYGPQPIQAQSPNSAPQRRNWALGCLGAAGVFFILVIAIVVVATLAKPAPRPSALSSEDSGFILIVADDTSVEG